MLHIYTLENTDLGVVILTISRFVSWYLDRFAKAFRRFT